VATNARPSLRAETLGVSARRASVEGLGDLRRGQISYSEPEGARDAFVAAVCGLMGVVERSRAPGHSLSPLPVPSVRVTDSAR
jgi:hypothetical protein